MSNKISLKKRQEVLAVSLKKKSIGDGIVLRVGAALDISGSMHSLYRNGTVSEFVGKLLPFGMKFDDNAQIDMWAFDHGVRELPPAVESVYDDYVGNCMKGVSISGGTAYAPVMKAIYDEYFGGKQKTKTVQREVEVVEQVPAKGFLAKLTGKTESVVTKRVITETVPDGFEASVDTTPAMIFFQTDGENNDETEVLRLLEKHVDTPVYWFMVGVGNSSFRFLKKIADEFPNVDFISIADMGLSDEDLYDKLLSQEFGGWVEKVGAKRV